MSNVDPAARGADPLRHGPDPQLQKAARGKSPRWRSYSSVSLVVRHIQKLTDTRRCQTQDELHSSVINVDETGCGFLRAFRWKDVSCSITQWKTCSDLLSSGSRGSGFRVQVVDNKHVISFSSQSIGASREAELRVRPAVPGLGPGRADGANQLWFPGGTAAEWKHDGQGVSGRPAGGRQRATEKGLLMINILLRQRRPNLTY